MIQENKKLPILILRLLNSKVVGNIFVLCVLGIGLFLGWFLKGKSLGTESDLSSNLRENGYEYISPLLDAEPRVMSSQKDLVDLEGGINTLIDVILNTTANSIGHISVYFKEFSSGAWIGINENEKFTPASLLKLPLMMAYYKIAESNPSYLNTKIKYESTENVPNQNITPSVTLIEGNSYSIDDLIKIMIMYSDNKAYAVLLDYLKLQDQKKAYTDLGLQFPDENVPDDFMTVKDYAGFFRILYNASYLNKEMSSKALALLTEVTFDRGLIAGVQKGVKVAHKFGERGYPQNNIKQLHDCGIVYYPRKPYLLCVMTRGNNFGDLENVIAKISKFVYQRISH